MTTTQKNTITLNADNFEREVLQSKKPVLVDFWAPWCAPCKAIGPAVEQIASEFDSKAIVGKVDVDENSSLAQRYAIGSIPTFLFFKGGEIVDRIQGVVPVSQLTDKLTALSQ